MLRSASVGALVQMACEGLDAAPVERYPSSRPVLGLTTFRPDCDHAADPEAMLPAPGDRTHPDPSCACGPAAVPGARVRQDAAPRSPAIPQAGADCPVPSTIFLSSGDVFTVTASYDDAMTAMLDPADLPTVFTTVVYVDPDADWYDEDDDDPTYEEAPLIVRPAALTAVRALLPSAERALERARGRELHGDD